MVIPVNIRDVIDFIMGISDQDEDGGMIEVLDVVEELPFQTFISYT